MAGNLTTSTDIDASPDTGETTSVTPSAGGLLAGKKLVITGVVTTDSIAWATTVAAIGHGAEVLVTAAPRDLERAEAVAGTVGLDVQPLDVTNDDDWQRVASVIASRFGTVHGALHAVAWAPGDALSGTFAGPVPQRLDLSFATSVSSYARLAGVVADLADPAGASVVGLDFDSSRAWGTYNWMGVMKSALVAANRYVARDLGPRAIRSNLVAAGPLHTRAAGGIPGFDTLLDSWERAPLGWDPTDATPVADAVCFLFSDLARAVTGQVLSVDGGHSAVQGNAVMAADDE
jgi:meromycolic acid enoyl-[acyl-carrier-protein] reductase